MDPVPVVAANAATAALVFAAAAVVCVVARSPAVAHKAWLLVLLKLVAPPLVVLPVVWPTTGDPEVGRAGGVSPLLEPSPVDVVNRGLTPPARPEPDDFPAADDIAPPPVAEASEPVAPDPPAPFPWQTALIAVWVAGALGYWLLVAVRVARFGRALRYATPAPAVVVAAVRRTADRLGLRRTPVVLFVGAAVSPMVWAGFGRPRLILPRRLWDRLPDDQREAILAHELAHLRRGDHWVRRLELVALGLYWWFPVAWLACRRLRDAEEACCDAWVVWALPGRAAAYAAALVETVAFVSRPGWVPLASGGAARAESLKRRLTMILSNTPTRKGRRAVAFGLLAAGLVVLPLRPGLADDVVTPVADPPAVERAAGVEVFEYPVDDPVNLGDEVRWTVKLQPKAAAPPAEVAKLRDEFELLEAQGAVKSAQVRAAEVAVKSAARMVDLLKKAGANTISSAELATHTTALESAEAQLGVRQAEMNEHAVKVKQAKRRLEEAQVARPAADAPATSVRKSAVDALNAGGKKLSAAAKDKLKADDAARHLMDDFAKTQTAYKDLTAKRAQLEDQLKALTQQQGAMMAQMEEMRAKIEDLRKRFPDATRPGKP